MKSNSSHHNLYFINSIQIFKFNKAIPTTIPPNCSTSFIAASIVPPVASKSSVLKLVVLV